MTPEAHTGCYVGTPDTQALSRVQSVRTNKLEDVPKARDDTTETEKIAGGETGVE